MVKLGETDNGNTCLVVSRHHLEGLFIPAPVFQHLAWRLNEISLHVVSYDRGETMDNIDSFWGVSIPRLSAPSCHLLGKINALGTFFSTRHLYL